MALMLLSLHICEIKNQPGVENMKNKRNLEQREKFYSTDYILDQKKKKIQNANRLRSTFTYLKIIKSTISE